MDWVSWILARGTAAFQCLPPWERASLILVGMVALVRGGIKSGAALFTGAVLLAIAFDQGLEPFANALNQGVTGVPTIRLFLSLGALIWMADILKDGAAARRIRNGIALSIPEPRTRRIMTEALEGLLPGESPAGWFPRLAPLALPVGAGFVVACSLGSLPAARASALLLPLALAMAAVGLWALPARASDRETAAQPLTAGVPQALIPVLLLLILAFWLPEPRIPEVRSTGTWTRLTEGVKGLFTPVALGAALGGLAAARLLGVPLAACRSGLKRAFSMDLAVLAVGLSLFGKVATVQSPEGAASSAVAASMQGWAFLASPIGLAALALLLPAALAFAMRGAPEGLAVSLPFLLPLAGRSWGDARLAALAFAGAYLGETLDKGGRRMALPVGLTLILAGALALAP